MGVNGLPSFLTGGLFNSSQCFSLIVLRMTHTSYAFLEKGVNTLVRMAWI